MQITNPPTIDKFAVRQARFVVFAQASQFSRIQRDLTAGGDRLPKYSIRFGT